MKTIDIASSKTISQDSYQAAPRKTIMRWYGYPALVSLVVCQYLMFQRVEPVYTFFTPIQWWNYIFLADAIVWGRQRKSLITDRPLEFLIMLVLSNLCWLLFEGYNYLLKNWYYVGLSPELWKRLVGYSTSFASIFVGIFITADLLESFGLFHDKHPKARKFSNLFLAGSFASGLACVVFPLIFPSPFVFGLVWIGYFFLLEPVNYWMGNSSIYRDIEDGKWQRFWLLLAGGAVCGLLWEFWNYWAHAKWIYTVPFTKNTKYFEMPLLGFLGFPPFALECFAMYHFMRRLLGR
jgi:hypothetical protein